MNTTIEIIANNWHAIVLVGMLWIIGIVGTWAIVSAAVHDDRLMRQAWTPKPGSLWVRADGSDLTYEVRSVSGPDILAVCEHDPRHPGRHSWFGPVEQFTVEFRPAVVLADLD